MDLSIIIPTYNRRELLRKTIESCADIQGLQFEIIVIDDGSTDGTENMVQTIGMDVRYYKQQRQGAAVARNKGMSFAQGTYIKFLDSDDLLDADGIQKQWQIAQSTNADLAYGRWNFSPETSAAKGDPQEDLPTFLLIGWWFPNFAYLYNRKFLLHNKCSWESKYSLLDDYHFILSVLAHNPSVVFTDCLTGFYRNHANDARVSRADEDARSEVRRAILKEIQAALEKEATHTPIRSYIMHTQICVHSQFAKRNLIQRMWKKIMQKGITRREVQAM